MWRIGLRVSVASAVVTFALSARASSTAPVEESSTHEGTSQTATSAGPSEHSVAGELSTRPTTEAPPKPAPYSIPWGLRPIVAPTVVRLDTSFARYEDKVASSGITSATVLTASYRVPGTGPATAGLAPVLRLAFVADDPPSGTGGTAFVNPLVGAAYALKLEGGFRLNAFLGVTIPIGMGGGRSPDAGPLDARLKGPNARAQLENALFSVNDCTVVPGIGAAWVKHGWTVQVEATVLQLMRVRGESVQREASKTNLTSGLHVGRFIVPSLSVGGELRYQRWLNPPFAVERDSTDASRDTMTFALGPRFHVELGALGWLRPGISYQRAVDKPLAAAAPNYHIVQLDIPLLFK